MMCYYGFYFFPAFIRDGNVHPSEDQKIQELDSVVIIRPETGALVKVGGWGGTSPGLWESATNRVGGFTVQQGDDSGQTGQRWKVFVLPRPKPEIRPEPAQTPSGDTWRSRLTWEVWSSGVLF